jgi:hypothetical protein
VLIVVLFVVVPYIDLSRTEMGAEEEKNSKRKVGTHIPLNKNLLEARRQRTHTHTHAHAHAKKKLKKLKKKLKKKKTKRRRKNGERKIRGR